jgi:predicted DNA-binding WGR domain protein
LEKKIKVPDSWLRGFLQVQSASMLPSDRFTISPIDLYNALRHLRMHADQKGKRRGLRIELIPGERPRLVLEPWETVVETTAEKYQGSQAKVVRVWGRRRLSLLRRMLPLVTTVEVHLTGSGLPSFWVLRSPIVNFTMAITGFTAANWSKALDFDLMMPRHASSDKALEKIVKHLTTSWKDTEEGLAKASKLTGERLIEQVQSGCQQGQLIYDVPDRVYRLRPLTDVPLNLERLEFRSQSERRAHDLLHRKNALAIVTENRIFGVGLELTGKANVDEDRREYRVQMLINEEGFVGRADCTCSQFRTHGLKSGPCMHLIALRLAHSQRVREQRRGSGNSAITVETRNYSRRVGNVEHLYQISMDRKRVKVRWGNSGEQLRIQQLHFASIDEARNDYLMRVADLVSSGYLDASSED